MILLTILVSSLFDIVMLHIKFWIYYLNKMWYYANIYDDIRSIAITDTIAAVSTLEDDWVLLDNIRYMVNRDAMAVSTLNF